MSLRSRLAQQLGLTDKSSSPSAAPLSPAPMGNAQELPVRVDGPESMAAETEVYGVFLTPHEIRHRTIILERLYQIMDLTRINDLGQGEARKQIAELTRIIIEQDNMALSAESRKNVIEQVEAEILGLGPLEVVLQDPAVSDIMVNGPHNVYVEKKGLLCRSAIMFDDSAHLMRIIDRVVSSVGRRVDESVPMVDARLKDGSRVNVILPPLSLDGPILSIRRFPAQPLTLTGLVERNALSPVMARFLMAAVQGRKNIIISGGTGSGKTTLLNGLSAFIPSNERIVTIEDAAELQLQQAHVVRLETRPPNIEERGEVTQRDLVRNALRMRPDRVIVGEVRGQEAFDMLQAMNTGHDGSLTTVHANSARDAISRIENMVAMADCSLPVRVVRQQIAAGIDLVVQVERMEDGSRRVMNVSEITGMEGDILTMSDIYIFERAGLDAQGRVIGQFKPTGAIPTFFDELRRRGIDVNLDMFDAVSAEE